MKSFPSTLNEAGHMYGNTNSQTYAQTFDVSRIRALNLNSSVPVIQELYKENNINISNYQQMTPMHTIDGLTMTINDSKDKEESNTGEQKEQQQTPEKIRYENPLQIPAEALALIKDYSWQYNVATAALFAAEKNGDDTDLIISRTPIAPSMFNPMYGVNVIGLTRNTPLLNGVELGGSASIPKDIDDCSIRKLCTLSKDANSELGMARYKYSDFMYCKDLGKVSNNHMITLRRFSLPVPDHIGALSAPKHANAKASWAGVGDVGRLITWFGTDDNKLEDICKYNYFASWKELTAEIQEEESKADDPNTGIIGMLSNSLNPVYNKAAGGGYYGTNNIFQWFGSKLTSATAKGIGSNNHMLRNYDKNKIYDEKDVVHTTHIYEGKLHFTHEFTLNFSYVLRGYDNINPRSAMLDLLANILEVTYKRGHFWKGKHKLIGPPQDVSLFNKANSMIDKAFDTVGGFLSSLNSGAFNFNNIMGQIGSMASNMLQSILNMNVKQTVSNGMEFVANTAKTVMNNAKDLAMGENVKGMVKNALGRPQLYAWHSLLSGDDVGLWHVMIGNPRNPILSIGNLIMTNAQVTHSGPLGIDDFPTELKVSITLKHAMPRDLTKIGYMYTQGISTLYQEKAPHNIEDFWNTGGGGSPAATDDTNKTPEAIAAEENAKANKEATAQVTTTSSQDAGNEKAKTETSIPDKKEEQKGPDTQTRILSESEAYNEMKYVMSSVNPIIWGDGPAINLEQMNHYSETALRMMLDERA